MASIPSQPPPLIHPPPPLVMIPSSGRHCLYSEVEMVGRTGAKGLAAGRRSRRLMVAISSGESQKSM
uniref:Uncharacterized protein n=1 Tax=Oryza sativa subsp. japonica TaxID=39947 RepID=Q8GVV0_ORYSJ|nr:hypothetical protein [Oryza sativa Japonica Group]